MADEGTGTTEAEAPMSDAERDAVFNETFNEAAAEHTATDKGGAPAKKADPVNTGASTNDGAAQPTKVGDEDTSDPKAAVEGADASKSKTQDDITAAAQAAIKAEQDRQNAETVAAAARKLQEQQAEEARRSAEASGQPVAIDVQATLKEIIDGASGVMIPDVDDNGKPTQRNLKEWAEAYPGIPQVAAIMASKLAEKIVEQRLGAIQAQLQPLVQAQERAQFEQKRGEVFTALAKPELGAHADAREIVESGAYAEAIGKAPDVIRTCAESWDPAMQKLALEWYKAKAGIKSAARAEAEAEHKRRSTPAAAGLRSNAQRPPARSGDDEELSADERRKIFNESYTEAAIPA